MKLRGLPTNLTAGIRVQKEESFYWSATAGLLFTMQKKGHIAGIQAFAHENEPEKLKIAIRTPGSDNTDIFAWAPSKGTLLISARLENGTLVASTGRIQKVAKIGNEAITGAVLMCSSGVIDFDLPPGLELDPGASDFRPWNPQTK